MRVSGHTLVSLSYASFQLSDSTTPSLARSVPLRRVRSVYDHTRYISHSFRKPGKWTEIDDARLRVSLYTLECVSPHGLLNSLARLLIGSGLGSLWSALLTSAVADTNASRKRESRNEGKNIMIHLLTRY